MVPAALRGELLADLHVHAMQAGNHRAQRSVSNGVGGSHATAGARQALTLHQKHRGRARWCRSMAGRQAGRQGPPHLCHVGQLDRRVVRLKPPAHASPGTATKPSQAQRWLSTMQLPGARSQGSYVHVSNTQLAPAPCGAMPAPHPWARTHLSIESLRWRSTSSGVMTHHDTSTTPALPRLRNRPMAGVGSQGAHAAGARCTGCAATMRQRPGGPAVASGVWDWGGLGSLQAVWR